MLQDIYNRLGVLKRVQRQDGRLDEYLTSIRADGGIVKVAENSTGEVELLFIQLKGWHEDLVHSRPISFQLDTTFGTNKVDHLLEMPIENVHNICPLL